MTLNEFFRVVITHHIHIWSLGQLCLKTRVWFHVRAPSAVEEPLVQHVGQVQFYLNTLGVENGRLDYVDKTVLLSGRGDRVDVSFPVKRDPRFFERWIHRAIVLESYISAGEAPPPEKCWLCRYCGHREECPVG